MRTTSKNITRDTKKLRTRRVEVKNRAPLDPIPLPHSPDIAALTSGR